VTLLDELRRLLAEEEEARQPQRKLVTSTTFVDPDGTETLREGDPSPEDADIVVRLRFIASNGDGCPAGKPPEPRTDTTSGQSKPSTDAERPGCAAYYADLERCRQLKREPINGWRRKR
jgi:hypothetical protein